MQTFLPHPSFVQSAKILDYRRLGKQRVEAFQILKALLVGGAWSKHPAVLMWKNYDESLMVYHDCMIREWVGRGYRNTMPLFYPKGDHFPDCPPWLGNEAFHASHRSNLLRKNKEYYSQFNWSEPDNLEYIWPV